MRVFAGVLPSAVAAVVVLAVAAGSAAAQEHLAITPVTVVDVTDGSLQADRTVLVEGDRIAAIGPADEMAVPDGATVVDGTGGYLVPGLWDMHVHASRAGRTPRFWPLLLAHGVTGIRDLGSFTDSLVYWRAES